MNNEDSITKTTGTAEKPTNMIDNTILITTVEVCKRLSIGKSLFFRLLSSGQIGPLPIRALGRRVLWNRKEIEAWADGGCVSREQWQAMRPENK